MEKSCKATHLWVNNIHMDILVWPQPEHLCDCLIHTYSFCHKNEKGQQRSEHPQKVSSGLQIQKQYSETVIKHLGPQQETTASFSYGPIQESLK